MGFFNFWKRHSFKVLVIGSALVLLVLAAFNDRESGTWSLEYSYNPQTKRARFTRESKGERECRRVLERIFHRAFPNMRPSFLENEVTGRALEIDCCNMDLKLGVEYNGKQHYQYIPGMHKDYADFERQQYRDEMKRTMCALNKFTLITVPHTVPLQSIENYIREELVKHGWVVP